MHGQERGELPLQKFPYGPHLWAVGDWVSAESRVSRVTEVQAGWVVSCIVGQSGEPGGLSHSCLSPVGPPEHEREYCRRSVLFHSVQ